LVEKPNHKVIVDGLPRDQGHAPLCRGVQDGKHRRVRGIVLSIGSSVLHESIVEEALGPVHVIENCPSFDGSRTILECVIANIKTLSFSIIEV